MAETKIKYSSLVSMTITNLNSLVNSATTGWQSDIINNASTRYVDILVQPVLSFATAAPANLKGALVFVAGGLTSGKLANPASGAQGSISLVSVVGNVQTIRHIGTVPYTTAGEDAEGQPMSVAAAYGQIMPPYCSIIIVNRSGAALTTGGNSVKYLGITLGT